MPWVSPHEYNEQPASSSVLSHLTSSQTDINICFAAYSYYSKSFMNPLSVFGTPRLAPFQWQRDSPFLP